MNEIFLMASSLLSNSSDFSIGDKIFSGSKAKALCCRFFNATLCITIDCCFILWIIFVVMKYPTPSSQSCEVTYIHTHTHTHTHTHRVSTALYLSLLQGLVACLTIPCLFYYIPLAIKPFHYSVPFHSSSTLSDCIPFKNTTILKMYIC